MADLKQQVLKLRKKGKSYREISLEIGVPKSTLSGWLSNLRWSNGIRQSLITESQLKAMPKLRAMAEANKKFWENQRVVFRKRAEEEFPNILHSPLFIAGLALYWGEGDKSTRPVVSLTNTDPNLVRVFVEFLTSCLGIERSRVKPTLILYPDLAPLACLSFWSKQIGIPQNQFWKSQVIVGKHKTRRLPYGTCQVRVSNRALKEKILTWIQLLHNEMAPLRE